MNRRAFTIMETVLAAAIGGVIVLAAMSIFSMLDRSDTRLGRRFERTSELSLTQRALSRAFSSLVMSNANPPPRPPGTTAAGSNANGANSANSQAAAGASGQNLSAPGGARATPASGPESGGLRDSFSRGTSGAGTTTDQPPRILLEDDRNLSGARMTRVSNGVVTPVNAPAQRLELVVSQSPIPRIATPTTRREATEDSGDASDRAERDVDSPGTFRTFRGSLELRPEPARENSPETFQLWWVPLPPRAANGDILTDTAPLDPPSRLISNLTLCTFRVFDNSELKNSYSAVFQRDLPAYIKVELATVEGFYADWMFEVDWTNASEADADIDRQTGTDGNSGGSANTPAAGRGAGQNLRATPAGGGATRMGPGIRRGVSPSAPPQGTPNGGALPLTLLALRRRPGNPRRPRRSRAFALPLVMLVSLFASLLIMAMLDRVGAQRRTAARAASFYRDTHFARGMRELIDAWLRANTSRGLTRLLDASGKALDIELGDGTVLSVYLADAQGTVLSNTANLSRGQQDAANLLISELTEAVGADEVGRFTRTLGPVSISLQSAKPEVLWAACAAVAGSSKADQLRDALTELRERQDAGREGIASAAADADLDDAETEMLQRLITVEPGFFRLTVDARLPGTGPSASPDVRYGGYAVVPSPGMGRGRGGASAFSRTSIINWQKLSFR